MRYIAVILCLFLVGCVQKAPHLDGGTAVIPPLGSSKPSIITGPEDTKTPATYQQLETKAKPNSTITVKHEVIPSVIGTLLLEKNEITTYSIPTDATNANVRISQFNSGTNQKDKARDDWAALALEQVKIASMQPLVWLGVALVLFGVASMVYPPLKVVIASTTCSLAIAGVGAVFVILPELVIGHEVLIMSVGLGLLTAYIFAHRHGKLQGTIDSTNP